jgi:hypothetical protein
MRQLGRADQGVRFTDGSGYLGTLSVYHSLHCIVSLRSDCAWIPFSDVEALTLPFTCPCRNVSITFSMLTTTGQTLQNQSWSL